MRRDFHSCGSHGFLHAGLTPTCVGTCSTARWRMDGNRSTPTCVGTTCPSAMLLGAYTVYSHMRGDYLTPSSAYLVLAVYPHMRGDM